MTAPLQIVPWNTTPKPFAKWAGGKGQLLESLEKFFPEAFENYYEPFLGGGAVFFCLVNSRSHRFNALLSDINMELINTYRIIRYQVEDLITQLKIHDEKYRVDLEKYFYKVRKFEPLTDVEKAARLIFLNKTCFNGLYRVNSKGEFNVPFGRYKNPTICNEKNLRAVSEVLKWSNAQLLSVDFEEAVKGAKESDFIYFDPPYHPVSSTANFTSYTENGFNENDQKRLASLCVELRERGCDVLLSNSNTPEIGALYNDQEKFKVKEVPALRAINCKGNLRTGHTELIITTTKYKR